MYYASHDITVAYTFNYICLWKAVKRGLDIMLVFVKLDDDTNLLVLFLPVSGISNLNEKFLVSPSNLQHYNQCY